MTDRKTLQTPGAQTARDIIEASLYLVLATAGATGRPWIPVPLT